jgi:hypothetical protein
LVCAIGVDTVLVHAGAPVHAGSPPPVAVTVLILGLTAAPSMVTGTLMTVLPMGLPVAMVQPASVFEPMMVGATQVIPVAVGNAVSVMPVGKRSVSVIGAVVAATETAMLIVYDCPLAATTSGVLLAVLVMLSLGAITGVVTLLVQAGAAPVHSGSPPPVTVTALMADGKAAPVTSTGTVMVISPTPAPRGIVHPAKVLPDVGQLAKEAPALVVSAPTTMVGGPLKVMPAGKRSAKVAAAMVALPAMVSLMV